MATGYTWDNAMVEGRRRLALLEDSLDPTTFRRLEQIGVAPMTIGVWARKPS